MASKRKTRLFQSWRVPPVMAFAIAVWAFLGCDDSSNSALSTTSKSAAVSTWYAPQEGTEKVCNIESKGKIEIDYGLLSHGFNPSAPMARKAGLTPHAFDLTTELHSRVLGQEDGNYVVAMRLQKHRATIDGNDEERTSLFETPFIVHVNGTGAFVKYEFPGMFPKDALARIRGVVESLQVVGPAEQDARAWNADERTSGGKRSVSYKVSTQSSGKIVANRKLVSSNESAAFFDMKNRPKVSNRIQRSKGTVVWASDGSGLLSLVSNEAMNSTYDRQALDTQQHALKVSCSPASNLSLPPTTGDARAELKRDRFTKVAFYAVSPKMTKKLKDLPLDKLISNYKETFKSERAEAFTSAKYWLRLNPLKSKRFVETLAEMPETTSSDRLVLAHGMSALASAGHTEAQAALTDVIADAGYSPVLRDFAVRSTLNLPRPESSLVESVWHYRENMPTPENQQERTIQSMMTAIYGALGDVENGRPEVTEQVVDNLDGMLQRARTLQDRVDVLNALGNVGDLSSTMPLIEPYFQSEDWQLRGNAFSAFQAAVGDDAFKSFTTFFEKEENGYARRIAATVATNMPYSKTRNQWMQKQLFLEDDSTIATKYAEVLGDSLKIHPENEDVMRKMLDETHDRSIRRTIYRYISPNPAGGVR